MTDIDPRAYTSEIQALTKVFTQKPELRFKVGEYLIGWDAKKKDFFVQKLNADGVPEAKPALSKANGVKKVLIAGCGSDRKTSSHIRNVLNAISGETYFSQENIVDLAMTVNPQDSKFRYNSFEFQFFYCPVCS